MVFLPSSCFDRVLSSRRHLASFRRSSNFTQPQRRPVFEKFVISRPWYQQVISEPSSQEDAFFSGHSPVGVVLESLSQRVLNIVPNRRVIFFSPFEPYEPFFIAIVVSFHNFDRTSPSRLRPLVTQTLLISFQQCHLKTTSVVAFGIFFCIIINAFLILININLLFFTS
jgi:hypothetical protein